MRVRVRVYMRCTQTHNTQMHNNRKSAWLVGAQNQQYWLCARKTREGIRGQSQSERRTFRKRRDLVASSHPPPARESAIVDQVLREPKLCPARLVSLPRNCAQSEHSGPPCSGGNQMPVELHRKRSLGRSSASGQSIRCARQRDQ